MFAKDKEPGCLVSGFYAALVFVLAFLAFAGTRAIGEAWKLDEWVLDWLSILVWAVTLVLLFNGLLARSKRP